MVCRSRVQRKAMGLRGGVGMSHTQRQALVRTRLGPEARSVPEKGVSSLSREVFGRGSLTRHLRVPNSVWPGSGGAWAVA